MLKLTHLERLESGSIHLIREVAAECGNPVMLYSIGKDCTVLLHLAMKAFYPALPPFPLLYVDAGGFDAPVKIPGMNLIVETEGLQQALEKYGFDAAFEALRRDEGKISLGPQRQRPELRVPREPFVDQPQAGRACAGGGGQGLDGRRRDRHLHRQRRAV